MPPGPDTANSKRGIRLAERLAATDPDSALRALQIQWDDPSSPSVRKRIGLDYFMARAHAWFKAVKMTAAMQACDSAMRYLRAGKEDEDEASILMMKGRIFAAVGDHANAHRSLDASLRVYASLGDQQRMAECNNEMGWVHYAQEQYVLAERRWRAMLLIAREMGDRRLEAIALRRVGLACLYLYDPPDIGHAYYDSALVASRILGDLGELARIHSNIGIHMDSALFYARVSGDEALLYDIMHTAGIIGMRTGDAGPGLEYCEPALRFARRVGDRMLERDALQCICDAHKLAGSWEEAFDAMEQWRKINDQMISSRSRDEIAMRAVGREFEERSFRDSLSHAAELLRLESDRTIQRLRADRIRNRAIGLGAGGSMMLVGGLVFFRMDRKRRRERFERDAARMQMQVLRTQMNPHFIFNALNSINSYVQENERELASGFLTKFARLMRLVLENSRHNEVPLAQDLEALRLYMDLERARMSGKFDYVIDVDPALDQATTMVPPLVLQPFVENAIWHGISGKERKGTITLTVRREGPTLRITVQDDGVGRQAPDIPSMPDAPPKTSLGTSITHDRLAMFGRQQGGEAGFQYVEVPAGTRVDLQIPLNRADL